MKTITLADGTVLSPFDISGNTINDNGLNRNAITFKFKQKLGTDIGFQYIDNCFSEKNCERIIIKDDENNTSYIHDGYTLRISCGKEVKTSYVNQSEIRHDVITVTMAQRTYIEHKIQDIQDDITLTQLALCEYLSTLHDDIPSNDNIAYLYYVLLKKRKISRIPEKFRSYVLELVRTDKANNNQSQYVE